MDSVSSMVEMAGESRCQGSSTGCAGAIGVLDCGFPGVFSSYTRIRTHFAVLDAGSTFIIFHQRKQTLAGLFCWWRWRESNPRPRVFPKDLLRAQPVAIASLTRRQWANSGFRYPVDTLTLPGAYARGPCIADAGFSGCR